MGYKGRYKRPANFFIEGVSATINTKSKLLYELFLYTTIAYQKRVRNFKIVNDDIEFEAKGGQYAQWQLSWNPTPGIKSYLDIDGHINNINQGVFDSCTTLKYIWIPNCTAIQGPSGYFTMRNLYGLHWYVYFPLVNYTKNHVLNFASSVKTLIMPALTWLDIQLSSRYAYHNMTALERCYLPSLTTVTYYAGTVRHFVGVKFGCIFYVPPALETSNGGAREQLIAYLEDSRLCDIRYIQNFTAPDAVNDLSSSNVGANSVDLNFTTPASTNAIDFYEVWVNDFKTKGMPYFAFQEIALSGDTLSGLEAGTTYEIKIKTVDIYYNVSGFSNSINVLIGAGASNFTTTRLKPKFAVVAPVIDIEQNFFAATIIPAGFAVIAPVVDIEQNFFNATAIDSGFSIIEPTVQIT